MTGERRRDLDEPDLALIDALHVNPRATAEQLAATLGISPATVTRRWRRLVEAGQAWVSSAPGPNLPVAGAIFEAECQPGRASEAASALAALPQVASVGIVTGSTDLYALVVAGSPGSLARLLTRELPAVPGLLRTRSSVLTTLFSSANWRLGAIRAAQESSIRPRSTSASDGSSISGFDRAIYLALQHDGRRTNRDLATALGRSEHVVNRRVAAMTRGGLITFRTDFVRPEAGWSSQVLLRLHVPPQELHAIGQELRARPETRVCAAVTGAANLICTVLLHRLSDLDGWLQRACTDLPGIAVIDQHVILQSVKSWGRLLDDNGYGAGVVAVDPWHHYGPPHP